MHTPPSCHDFPCPQGGIALWPLLAVPSLVATADSTPGVFLPFVTIVLNRH